MLVTRPGDGGAQFVVARAGDHKPEIRMHVVAKCVIQIAAVLRAEEALRGDDVWRVGHGVSAFVSSRIVR